MLKKYALAVGAWNVSSYVTLYQMGLAKTVWPETYEFVMDLASPIASVSWDLCTAAWEVCWDFLNSS